MSSSLRILVGSITVSFNNSDPFGVALYCTAVSGQGLLARTVSYCDGSDTKIKVNLV